MVILRLSPDVEYQKNPNIKKEDIDDLLNWIENQPKLPNISELEMIIFHHGCSGVMESTKKKITDHFKIKNRWKEFFEDFDPLSPKIKHVLETGLFTMLPGTTKDGCRVLYSRLMDSDPTKYFHEIVIKIIIMILEMDQIENGTCSGILLVLDKEGATFGNANKINVCTLKSSVHFFQDFCPIHIKDLYFMNVSLLIHIVILVGKSFLNSSERKCINSYPSPIDSLFEIIPKEMFPKEISGNGMTFEEMRVKMHEKMIENRDFLIERMNLN